jgi:signal transduction histidine kinase
VRIEVRLSSSAPRDSRDARPRASVLVIDDGPGMGEERKAAAFHRYGHPEPRGNGLGLAIVHRLAAANGGRAELRDTPGGGLTVDLEWPLNEV